MLRHNKIEIKNQANKNERGVLKFGMLPNALAHFSKHCFWISPNSSCAADCCNSSRTFLYHWKKPSPPKWKVPLTVCKTKEVDIFRWCVRVNTLYSDTFYITHRQNYYLPFLWEKYQAIVTQCGTIKYRKNENLHMTALNNNVKYIDSTFLVLLATQKLQVTF